MAESIMEEIEQSFLFLKKASTTFDNRYVSKVLRGIRPLRKRLSSDTLAEVIGKTYPASYPQRQYLLSALETKVEDEPMETDDPICPEVDLYVNLLVQLYLLDSTKLDELNSLNQNLINLLTSYNKRSLDLILAKIWFYIARTNELRNDLVTIRPALYDALRTATLRHDDETSASLITLLLRNYLLTHDLSQAGYLLEKVEFPENAGSSFAARYYYYLARISAVQLNYSTAHEYVIAALRKVPQTNFANGFIQSATKLSIIIELSMGDIPELKQFKKGSGYYEPYFWVTKAVRLGDLKLFGEVLKKYESQFKKDDNYTLVSRLRQNVIKTGIRLISLSYSKISLKDICIKLHLNSEESTEYIVSKAIRDGVIEATIEHEKGYMMSKELLDIYSTKLPQSELDQRIKFCLDLHNDSVRSMRYPNVDENKEDLKKNLDSKEDEMDILKAIEEGDLDDFID